MCIFTPHPDHPMTSYKEIVFVSSDKRVYCLARLEHRDWIELPYSIHTPGYEELAEFSYSGKTEQEVIDKAIEYMRERGFKLKES